LVLLNPLVYRPMTGSVASPEVQQHLAADHYRRAMFDRERWKRLLAGGVDVRAPARFVVRKAKTVVAGRLSRIGALLGLRPGGTTGEFLSLLRRGTKIHVVFAAGDPGVEALRMELGGGTARLVQAGLDLEVIEGADHTFNASRIRHALIERIMTVISPSR
jgi:hypothetical protein